MSQFAFFYFFINHNFNVSIMKKIIFTLIIALFYSATSDAQVVEILKSVITAGGATETQGLVKANMGMSYPMGIQNVVTKGSEVVIPPISTSIEYGLFKNVSIGILGGYCKTKTPELSWEKITDPQTVTNILSEAQQLLCDFSPSTAAAQGINCAATTTTKGKVEEGSTAYALDYILLGLKAEFYFKGGSDRLLFSLGTHGGYKIVIKKPQGTEKPADASWKDSVVGKQVSDAVETVSNVFYVADLGVHYRFSNRWGAYFRGGYGYGYGDNIALGAQSVILSAGASYQIAAPKAERSDTKSGTPNARW